MRDNFLSRHIVVDVDDGTGTLGVVIAKGKVGSSLDEGLCGRLVEDLVSASRHGQIQSLERELGDDAEVASTTLESPEEIRVRRVSRGDLSAVTEDDFVFDHVVHGETVLVEKVAHAADQGQAGDANGLETAANSVLAVRRQGGIDVNPFVAGTDVDCVLVIVDCDCVQAVESKEDSVVDRVGSGVLQDMSA